MVGAIMMVTYDNLIMLFLGLEILSISLYVLTGSDKRNLLANEAALKYFLMGAFATGVLLYGVAMLYGATGSFSLTEIAVYVQDNATNLSPMLYIGLFMMLVGLLFKLSVAPFHWWTADVYTGAPNFFTAYMSTIVKTAGFAALYKLLSVSFVGVADYWFVILAICAIATLFIGNLTATAQKSFKRMLAYSGVSHAGYMLLAVASFSDKTPEAIFFYSLAYSVATITAFACLMRVSETKGSDEFASFYGLGKTNPFLAFALTVSMLSLAGIPLTAGFIGKLFVFMSALEQGHVVLVVLSVLMSAVGVYYYLRVVIAMYMRQGNGVPVLLTPRFRVVLVATTVLTILLGVFPGLVAGAL
jgi:NADH-quinone oxidoreductase subunit N